MNDSSRASLQPKDLITVGIFTALYFVLFFATGMMGYIPVLMLAIPFVCPLVAGIPFMLYLTKVKKFGMVTITGIISGILMFVTGMHWLGLVAAVITSLIAEALLRSGGYKSARKSILAYGVFSLWLMGMMIPIFFMRQGYFDSLRPVYGDEYADTLMSLTPTWAFFVMCGITFLGGIAGGLLGKSVLKKHFSRAGLA